MSIKITLPNGMLIGCEPTCRQRQVPCLRAGMPDCGMQACGQTLKNKINT